MLHYNSIGQSPGRWLVIAHGILGSGKNWRSFARALTREAPDWGAILVDLRMHGESQRLSPPHTLEAAASDVASLVEELGRRGHRVAGLLGHSFGGKVMLAARPRIAEVEVSWIVDASPSGRRGAMDASGDDAPAAVAALRHLEALPRHFAERGDMVAALVGRGVAEPVARWLALNLRRTGDGFELALELDAIRALLADYFDRDLWDSVESDGSGSLHVALAGRGSALDHVDRERLARLERRGALRCHHFPDAGHWIHVEAPGALVAAVASSLGDRD